MALTSKEALEKTPDNAPSRTASEVGLETLVRSAIAEPKLSLKNPSIRLRVNPSESKFSARPFASPSMGLLGPPASFQATAYALYGHTASGVYVRRGVVAADPRVIPLGSVVQIITPGYSGVYTVQDTGRLIKGNIVDLWMASSREARIFGRRQIRLHVLRWGPAKKKRGSRIEKRG
ncbi:MAG: 3D domain-containing protein [Blastocatellia bacterium]